MAKYLNDRGETVTNLIGGNNDDGIKPSGGFTMAGAFDEEFEAMTLLHKLTRPALASICEGRLGMAVHHEDSLSDLREAITDSMGCGDVTMSDLETANEEFPYVAD